MLSREKHFYTWLVFVGFFRNEKNFLANFEAENCHADFSYSKGRK